MRLEIISDLYDISRPFSSVNHDREILWCLLYFPKLHNHYVIYTNPRLDFVYKFIPEKSLNELLRLREIQWFWHFIYSHKILAKNLYVGGYIWTYTNKQKSFHQYTVCYKLRQHIFKILSSKFTTYVGIRKWILKSPKHIPSESNRPQTFSVASLGL